MLIIIMQIQALFFGFIFWLNAYQFLKNNHNEVYSLNTALSTALFIIVQIILFDFQIDHFFKFINVDILVYLQFLLVTFADISEISKSKMYSRLYEFISKLTLIIILQVYIINQSIYFYSIASAILIILMLINLIYVIREYKYNITVLLKIFSFLSGSSFLALIIYNHICKHYDIFSYILFLVYQIFQFTYYYRQLKNNNFYRGD